MPEQLTTPEDATATEAGSGGDRTNRERITGDVCDGEAPARQERDGTPTDGDVPTGDTAADGTDRVTDALAPADEPNDDDSRPRSIEKDDAFHLLQNSRRRAVLRYLLARPEREQFRMRDLAEEIAAWEHDTTVRQLSSDERQRVYIALYQSHLPKLDDHGVISYNQSRGFVEPTPLVDVLAPFLEDGLDAATQELSLDDAGPSASSGTRPDGRIVPTLSTLLGR